ncbi:hypothetical protein [Saccharothrix deserti]|uniref:hypothetical protein n=1 Tax=Saccharothrix deserti TaxID=2593674 RepID=UPI00131E7BB1|nr:hypothetical protein [Saccharothrix deserti]
MVPHLRDLGFVNLDGIDDLGELARFPNLATVSIRRCAVDDISPLEAVESLRTLEISTPVMPDYLDQIRLRVPQVSTLTILSNPDDQRDIDLSALGDRRMTVRVYRGRHRIVGAGKGIKVERI